MDDVADAYNMAVLEVVKGWMEEGDESFGVMWLVFSLRFGTEGQG